MKGFLFDYFGSGQPSATNLLGRPEDEIPTTRGGYATRVSNGRTKEDLDKYAASGPGWSSQQQYGSVAPPNPDIIRRAQTASLGAPLQAREPEAMLPRLAARDDPRALLPGRLPPPLTAPVPGGPMPPLQDRRQVAPHPMAPDVPMAAGMTAPRSLPAAGQPMPQQARGAQALMPSGAPPRRGLLGAAAEGVGNLLGGVKDWANAPMFDPSKPTSRLQAIGMMLGSVGAGLSSTGRIGTGLKMGNQTLMDLRQGEQERVGDEEERQYRRLDMELKRKKLEQEEAPQVFGGQETGYYTRGEDGKAQQIVPPSEATAKAPGSIESALFHPDPDIQARAEKLRQQELATKGAPTPYQQQQLELSRKRLDVDIARANRPSGSASAPAPTQVEKLIAFRDKLPPGHPDRAAVEAAIKKETTFATTGSGTTASGGPAKPKPLSAEYVGKNEAIKSGQAAAKRLREYYEPGGKFSPMAAGKAAIPLTGGALPGSEGVGAASDIDSAIDAIVRARTGAAATADEMATYYRMYRPNASDPPEVAKGKLDKLEADLAGVAGGFREAQGLEREEAPEPAASEIPAPTQGMSVAEYARLLKRNGMSDQQARETAIQRHKEMQGG